MVVDILCCVPHCMDRFKFNYSKMYMVKNIEKYNEELVDKKIIGKKGKRGIDGF